ncbi:hypothetical protein KIV66_gp94 [Mycobacterium phage MyraDee]|uniref:Uncharacterized protein n=1 Tax=Mycobacterium phage MyraDee TaxID=2024303 RepID=A0A222YY41_9CAUD|nr:hypothetical protein KIV66_gp94 [Mycobacterium phage MyraDee]ASR77201.1 hypothetical protein SEA_MYRADEE_94 [Mycobacterium phage MyraDee]
MALPVFTRQDDSTHVVIYGTPDGELLETYHASLEAAEREQAVVTRLGATGARIEQLGITEEKARDLLADLHRFATGELQRSLEAREKGQETFAERCDGAARAYEICAQYLHELL